MRSLHQIEQIFARHFGNTKSLVLLELDQPLGLEPHQGFAQRTEPHPIAIAQRLDAQPLVGHQPAGDDIGAKLAHADAFKV